MAVKFPNRPSIVRAQLILVALLLAACGGGGGGGGQSASFTLNTQSLTFTAPNPTSVAPARQGITGTVTGDLSGTLYILINATGQAVSNVSGVTISGNAGSAEVSVVPPPALGSGTFTSSIQVRACLNDSTCATGELADSPRTVSVTYTIGTPTVPDTVMPHAISAGATGKVVIRGHGFAGTSGVSFGGTPATSFTVVSDSEIRANYPALIAGTHAVTLSGGAAFSGSVVAVTPIAFTATLLTFPEQPQRLREVLYDAERQSLYVAANFAASTDNKLWRFRYTQGAWSAAETIPVANLEDVSLSADGTRLLVLTSNSVLEYDSANPENGPLKNTMAPTEVLQQLVPVTDSTFVSDTKHPVALTSIAVANDGTAIVATRYTDISQRAYLFFYSQQTGTFTQMQPFASFGMFASSSGQAPAIASADGSRVLVATSFTTGGDPAEQILQFNASTSVPSRVSEPVRQLWGRPPAVDSSASRIITFSGGQVVDPDIAYDGSFIELGQIPKANGVMANSVVVHPAGTRAYVLTQNPFPFNTSLQTYDLTVTGGTGSELQPAGTPVTISAPTADNHNLVLGTITPDGGTVFFAGDGGVSVVPAPQ